MKQPAGPPAAPPRATYRLQLRSGVGFAAAARLVPYLDALGISHLYSSPILAARAGSPHGYDVVDPTRLDPELGTQGELAALAARLAERGMGWLLDVVPNHLAATPDNPWWRDVLAHGRASRFAPAFDVDWEAGDGRILLPLLAEPFGDLLERGEIRLAAHEGGLAVEAPGLRLPLAPESAAEILGTLADFTGHPGDPESFSALDTLLARQPYRLAFWRLGIEEGSYRRFFDIGDLIGVRVEEPGVFAATHGLVLRLCREGLVAGLRIDHVDGLRDPQGYLERLHAALAEARARDPHRRGGDASEPWIVVEKILAADEELPAAWPVAGTTGYEFLNSLTGLFVEPRGLAALDRIYTRVTGMTASFEEIRRERKRQVLEELFRGEVRRLAARLARLAAPHRRARDLPRSELERALVEVTACLPVYRTYLRGPEVPPADRAWIEAALAEARRRSPPGPMAALALDFLAEVLLLRPPPYLDERRAEWLDFVLSWQQVSGPAMAKGFEDTALYVYNRLISLNAVGGEPEGIDPPGDASAFHGRNLARRAASPRGLLATSTHDSKRSEDVRARVNVLSEMPGEWEEALARWSRANEPAKRVVGGEPVPGANREIFLYQTLVGAWPLDDAELAEFRERLAAYLVKAVREAKVHSSWIEPDAEYEEALVAFARAILEEGPENRFLPDFRAFHPGVAAHGAWASLAQLLLKVGSPGVADFYQGCEMWDLSLVDPDNRRPIDFALREELLADLRGRWNADPGALLAELLGGWRDGRVKLLATWRGLEARRRRPELFLDGDYQPLEPRGEHAGHVVGFARRRGGDWALVAVPRWTASLGPGTAPPLGEELWASTTLALPGGAPTRWRDAISGAEVAASGSPATLAAGALFARFPGALLEGPA